MTDLVPVAPTGVTPTPRCLWCGDELAVCRQRTAAARGDQVRRAYRLRNESTREDEGVTRWEPLQT